MEITHASDVPAHPRRGGRVAQLVADSVSVDRELFISAFIQDATSRQLAEILPRLVPSPFGWFDQPICLPRFFEPASYIFLTDDRAVPRQRCEAMAARLRNPRVLECAGTHQAMLTRPCDVAAAVLAAAPSPAVHEAEDNSSPAGA
jgi:hypothetical protein